MTGDDRRPEPTNVAAERLFGAGSLEAAFGDGFQTVTPWRRAPRRKDAPLFDREAVTRVLKGPVRLVELDPRELTAHAVRLIRCDPYAVVANALRDMA